MIPVENGLKQLRGAELLHSGGMPAISALSASGIARLADMTTEWELVVPPLAALWLQGKGRNRKATARVVARYTKDMEAGAWKITHQGVAFNTRGELIDGQQRLQAIVASGRGQWLMVTRNLSQAAMEVLDRGKARSLAHTLQILGYEHSSPRLVATARAMYHGPKFHTGTGDVLTDVGLRQFIDAHLEALVFAGEALPGGRGPAALAGLVARAYYHAELGKLERFSLALTDQIPTGELMPGDATARRLKRVVDENRKNGGTVRTLLYRKAQNALMAFLEGRDLNKIYEADTDLFPLPQREGDGGLPEITA